MSLKIVLTGGPGTGKTTIMKQLHALGHDCQHEISRQVILQGQKNGVEQLFLKDPLAFSQALFEGRKTQYLQAAHQIQKPVFFDRGLPDVVAYMDYLNQQSPEQFLRDLDLHRYDHVFILPPWEAIHTQDNERYESFEQGQKIHHFIAKRYEDLGYTPIVVPTGSVAQRTNYILNYLQLL